MPKVVARLVEIGGIIRKHSATLKHDDEASIADVVPERVAGLSSAQVALNGVELSLQDPHGAALLPPRTGSRIAVLNGAKAAACKLDDESMSTAAPPPSTCDITTFGAAGDNKTDNTASIQRAIEACTRKGAATVIPAGGVYMSGPLLLPSHCTLYIEPGATLIASPDYRTWPNDTHDNWCHTTPYEAKKPVYVPQLADFLYTFDSHNVTVTGGGVVDGQGWRWYPLRGTPGPDGETGDYWHNCRPKLFAAWNATGLTMHNITLRNSPMYVVSAHSLLDASFTQVTIDSNQGWGYLGAPNTDGFNIQGENIYIGQSTVRNGDDCVRTLLPFSSNTGRTLTKPCLLPQVPIGPPSRNVLVEDLVCERGNGVVPIIWSNPGTIEDVVFRRVRNVYTKR